MEWEKTFLKNGYELLITYNAKTRKVIDFFIGTNDPSGTTSDYKTLMSICNINKKDPKYFVEPVPSINDKTKYTGLRIIKK